AIFRIRGAEDAGLRLLVEAGARVAIDRPAPDTAPADAAPWVALDDPLSRAVRSRDDARCVILKTPRQALGPEVEGQVHQPAMSVSGHDAKPLLHRASSFARRPSAAAAIYPSRAHARAETEKIRTKPLMFLDSAPEMQQIAAKAAAPGEIPSEQGIFCTLTANPPLLKTALSLYLSLLRDRTIV